MMNRLSVIPCYNSAMSDQAPRAVYAAHELDFISHSPAQTERIGQRIGALLQPGDLLLLVGTFGVGKTHLARGITRGLGSADLVTSPSFVLVNEYCAGPEHGKMPIYHVDLYRLADGDDLNTIGLEELWESNGVCLVEWPERAADIVPADHIAMHMSHLSETKRRLRLIPHGKRYNALVNQFKGMSFS
jgi:tRNA threonylcarbamoyladenosine biosynthesis protein TsaE